MNTKRNIDFFVRIPRKNSSGVDFVIASPTPVSVWELDKKDTWREGGVLFSLLLMGARGD